MADKGQSGSELSEEFDFKVGCTKDLCSHLFLLLWW